MIKNTIKTAEYEVFEKMVDHHDQILDALSNRVDNLNGCEDLESAGSSIAVLIDYITGEVLPHAKAEEETIYKSVLSDPRFDVLIKEMIQEHERVTEIYKNIATSRDFLHVKSLATDLSTLMKVHVGKENEEVLSYLLESNDFNLVEIFSTMVKRYTELKDGLNDDLKSVESTTVDSLFELVLESVKALENSGETDAAARMLAKLGAVLSERSDLVARANLELHRMVLKATRSGVSLKSKSDVKHQEKVGEGHANVFDLDVREMKPAKRHKTIFETFQNLEAGKGFMLINDHDPLPLKYQFEAEYANQFAWSYKESGPRVWKVEIVRVA